ncbi:hypothetical protein EST38_g10161 [Candolleomyces aberdarensis]|uniref:CENP-C homolog n=1 Tax=Candolleomyces aberdarensis TaxID=2316362 RepID=A0A4Q2D834_9AGAR|nr:hypothetical protein EST38_g10161 [Candolleomyces aberdarensis]
MSSANLEPLSASPSPQEPSVSGEGLQLCDQNLRAVDTRIAALERELEELKAQRSVIDRERENPEQGWDDDTPSDVNVIDYLSGQEVKRCVAWTAKMVNPQRLDNRSWSFHRIFENDGFIAAGQLVIPPNSLKPSKATKNNTYIFFVIEGAVNLKVHKTSLILTSGSMFMVPRGNTYSIENISKNDAKLLFTQACNTMNHAMVPDSVRDEPLPLYTRV